MTRKAVEVQGRDPEVRLYASCFEDGAFWYYVQEQGEVIDQGGENRELPRLADLVEATRQVVDWRNRRVQLVELRDRSLACYRQEISDLLRGVA